MTRLCIISCSYSQCVFCENKHDCKIKNKTKFISKNNKSSDQYKFYPIPDVCTTPYNEDYKLFLYELGNFLYDVEYDYSLESSIYTIDIPQVNYWHDRFKKDEK